jgi:hypothetical protein
MIFPALIVIAIANIVGANGPLTFQQAFNKAAADLAAYIEDVGPECGMWSNTAYYCGA